MTRGSGSSGSPALPRLADLTLGIVLALALAGGCSRSGSSPPPAPTRSSRSSSASYQATATTSAISAPTRWSILIRETLTRPGRDQGPGDGQPSSRRAWPARCWSTTPQLASFTPAKAGSKPAYGGWNSPCGQLMQHQPVQVVYGPGTFLNRAVAAVNTAGRTLDDRRADRDHEPPRPGAYRLATSRGIEQGAGPAGRDRGRRSSQHQQQIQQLEQLDLQLGHHRHAVDRRPAVHPRRSCSTRRAASTSPRRGSPTCSRPPTRR